MGDTDNLGSLTDCYIKQPNGKKALAVTLDAGIDGVVNKFGYNGDIDTGTDPEDVWDQGGTYAYTVAAGVAHYISSSAADTQDVTIRLLSASGTTWTLEEFDFTLVGQTKTALVTPSGNDPVRILSIVNNDTAALTGDVYVYENSAVAGGVPSDASKIRAKVLIANGRTLMAMYTVPSSKTGFILRASAALTGVVNTKPIISIYTRPFGSVFRLLRRAHLSLAGPATWSYEWRSSPVLAAKTDIKFTVDLVDADNTAVAAGFELQIQG